MYVYIGVYIYIYIYIRLSISVSIYSRIHARVKREPSPARGKPYTAQVLPLKLTKYTNMSLFTGI